MRNRILAITAIAAAMSAPIAAQAQNDTVGIVRGGSVIINDDVGGIAVDQRPAFREYIVRERVPEYTIPDRVVVGGVLPETGVTYYDVPQTFGVTPYRYTVVNGPCWSSRARAVSFRWSSKRLNALSGYRSGDRT
jgi:hypothetical protein